MPRLIQLLGVLLLFALPAMAATAPGGALTPLELAQGSGEGGGVTGLPLPRFVSLRADEVNLRTGPGIRYPIDWVYRREGLPVEIIDEFEAWRRIRDREGATGWVHQSTLSAERTAVVVGERRALRVEAEAGAEAAAWLEPGVIVRLERCGGDWCEARASDAAGASYRGFLLRAEIWGVYPDEIID